jgi:hypothetical protein
VSCDVVWGRVVDLSWTELTDACQFIIFTPLFLNLRALISHCLRLFMAIYVCVYVYGCVVQRSVACLVPPWESIVYGI